jgi:nitrite reductase (cytochrome c-552)
MEPSDRLFSVKTLILAAVSFVFGALIMVGIGLLLINIQERKSEALQYPLKVVDISPDEINPEVWGKNFPRQYDYFKKTEDDTISTPNGGSVPYSKLERNPALVRLWAGYAFSKDHNEERGHHYAQIDQQKTQRVKLVNQPGACANCHAAEVPGLIAKMGWEAFNKTPLNDLKDKLHYGSSCADCHDPKTMDLRITRLAFKNAMEKRGIDLSKATRQEMRSYVCAQCHVEYYFQGDNKLLTFPWDKGLNIDDIEAYYDAAGFKDWVHKETKAPMIKIQHPEFEMWSTSLHAKSGVSCADCHMPYIRDGAVKISDHWARSPLSNLNKACQSCHKADEQMLYERVMTIQNRTVELLGQTEKALLEAIDAINEAQKAGVSDESLDKARKLHRRASIRWDFVSSENSTGFHSPQESARVLAHAVDYARQAQLEAERTKTQPVAVKASPAP